MRTGRNIVVAGGKAGIGSAAAPYLTSQTLIVDVATRLVNATADDTAQTLLSNLMNLELMNKTALISGPTKDIGFVIASQLGTEGARLIVNG